MISDGYAVIAILLSRLGRIGVIARSQITHRRPPVAPWDASIWAPRLAMVAGRSTLATLIRCYGADGRNYMERLGVESRCDDAGTDTPSPRPHCPDNSG
jgi:hypothetical protein